MNLSLRYFGIFCAVMGLMACGSDQTAHVDILDDSGSATSTGTSSDNIYTDLTHATVVSSLGHSAVLTTNTVSFQGVQNSSMTTEDPFLLLGMDEVDKLLD